MSLIIGQPQQTGQDLILGELGKGAARGLSQSINSYNQQKQNRNTLEGLLPILEEAGIKFKPQDREAFLGSGLSPEIAARTAVDIHKTREAQRAKQEESQLKNQQAAMKQQMDMQEKQQQQQELAENFEYLESLVPYTGTTKIPFTKSATVGGLNREAIQKREEVNSLGFWMTDQIYTHFNKGTMSDSKLETVKKELSPRADLSERENRARINSLRRISKLPSDISRKELNGFINDEIKNTRKIPSKIPGEKEEIEFPTATNPETGQRLMLKEGKWQPLR